MAIPAMAPGLRLFWEDDDDAAVVEVVVLAGLVAECVGDAVLDAVGDEVVVKGFCDSDGHDCPGTSMKVLFSASCRCRLKLVLAFGLITPTIPKLMQLPGAVQ